MNKERRILETFKETCEREFVDLNLVFSIGGQISFDVYPKVWTENKNIGLG